ncbi:hypothetical protein M409DRAFT_57627 [Zasmidium cellare ATCC 36951]|uniref:Uncharacterized protein n=1 Tax=Zasmidium cellare ATCC 36951 TaxID=1080233 RepID=A0A6A6C8I4_ZASCE|nr:uncharacterized protein M409DRAFT_57627 [Zasmidium cellare ATCC 36951]KAF2163345.1 hypothetical protein M409DRAFT_57627 [Zasmidium cellare ATCC 36951]
MSATVGINHSHKHKAFRDKYKFATVVGDPHKTEKDDGTEDPHHITLNFSKTANGKGDTAAAHYYPDIHTIKFFRADLEDIVLTKAQIAEAEAEVAANPMVFEDRKKGIPVVWHEGEWVRAA